MPLTPTFLVGRSLHEQDDGLAWMRSCKEGCGCLRHVSLHAAGNELNASLTPLTLIAHPVLPLWAALP